MRAISRPDPIPFRTALAYWFRLGFISFGGPAGQIATMHRDLVETRRWISERRFLHALNYCMLLPGPEAQQLAIYIGWLLHRTWGGIVAGVLFVLPSFVVLTALGWAYLNYGEVGWVAGLLYGIKPAVTAIVLHAAVRLGTRTLRNAWLALIALIALLALAVLHWPFPLVIALAAASGLIGARLAPQAFTPTAATHAEVDDAGALTPPPTRWRPVHLLGVVAVGAVLWLLPMGLLLLAFGGDHMLTTMAWFFTSAALLTFGGAYAVLPYVYEAAVNEYNWVTPQQMMDGLALGESTPGPLIMVLVFIGFVGGYAEALFGTDQLLLAGMTAAAVVTWFTFLPSFIFIFAGAPLVEATRDRQRLAAPLTAITAATVGVIVSLALFFAQHTWWPQGLQKRIDAFAVVLTLLALAALLRLRVGVVPVLLACGLAGVVASLR